MMLKKLAVMMFSICLVMSTTAMVAYGAEAQTFVPGEIVVNGLYSQNGASRLSISSDGIATAYGAIYGLPGTTTKTTVHLYLQRYKNGDWVNVDDWLKSNDAVNCTLKKEVQVAKGYKYRVKASCYAYAGAKSENIVKYSSILTY